MVTNLNFGNLHLLELSKPDKEYISDFIEKWHSPNHTIFLFHTSGTSGIKKIIKHTRKTLLEAATTYISITKLNNKTIQYDTFPIGSIASVTMCILPWILVQHSLYITKFNKFKYLTDINKINPTLVNMVPAVCNLIYNSKGWKNLNFKNVTIPIGSDFVSNICYKALIDKQAKFIHIYGSTEVPPPCLYSYINKHLLGNPNVSFYIKDNELFIKWSSQKFYHETNDLFKIENDYLILQGRKNLMFKYKKDLVLPELLEAILKNIGVQHCLCILKNNIVTLYYEYCQELNYRTILLAIQKIYPDIKKIDLIKVASLEKNIMNKINRNIIPAVKCTVNK